MAYTNSVRRFMTFHTWVHHAPVGHLVSECDKQAEKDVAVLLSDKQIIKALEPCGCNAYKYIGGKDDA